MGDLGLQEFIPRLSPSFHSPAHLLKLTNAFERAVERARKPETGDPVRVVCSVPPRHEKTETMLHGVAWGLRRRPELTFGFISYGAALAESKSARARVLANTASVGMSPTMQKRAEWRSRAGGGLLATGIGGALTGQGLDIAIIDDPFKNRVEAESATHRQKVFDYHHDVAISRLEPGGAVFVVHARWHEDDLIGRLVAEGYELINFPAIDDEGRALLPSRYPADCELFREQQKVPYTWESLYQGRPRPRGARVFADVYLYKPDAIPNGVKIGIGVDFAYSEKTRADYSVAVVIARFEDRYFILDVIRRQVKSEVFEKELAQLAIRYPFADMLFRGSAIECEIAARMKRDGLRRLKYRTVHSDKFVAAEPAAKLWNGGQIMVPSDEEEDEMSDGGIIVATHPPYSLRHKWVPDYTAEMNAFTGVRDLHDDCVDATASAVECVDKAKGVPRVDSTTLLKIGLRRGDT